LAAFAWFLVLVLASRVALLGRDGPLGSRPALFMALAQGLTLCLAIPTTGLLALFGVILSANLGGAWLERRDPPRLPLYRLLVLVMILLAAGFAFAPAGGAGLRPAVQSAAGWLAAHWLYLGAGTGVAGVRSLILLAGALLVVNEANLLIRYVLLLLKVAPREPPAGPGAAPGGLIVLPPSHPAAAPRPLDQREYNTGRFIGVLERLLVYVLVLEGQYEAIGLILAAKSFARFRELDQRDFAEYVLIGTLLSVGTAVAIGEAVKAVVG
jgi:hypothetical protein